MDSRLVCQLVKSQFGQTQAIVSILNEKVQEGIPSEGSPSTDVEYEVIGQDIIEALNTVYRRHYNLREDFISSFWLGETANSQMLVRAEQILKDIKSKNIALIQGNRIKS